MPSNLYLLILHGNGVGILWPMWARVRVCVEGGGGGGGEVIPIEAH